MSRPIATAPAFARSYYKVVAVMPTANSERLRLVSIYDGSTEYALGEITSPPEGCWVCPDLLTCIQHASKLPYGCRMHDAPRAIVQARCWGEAPAAAAGHPTDTATKLCFASILPLALIPYTAAAQPNAPAGYDLTGGNAVRVLRDNRTASAPPPRPPMLRISAGEAIRRYGTDGGARLQAMTAGLHEDVLYAEARLDRIRAIGRVAEPSPGDVAARPPSAWIQRALEREAMGRAAAPSAARAR